MCKGEECEYMRKVELVLYNEKIIEERYNLEEARVD
jgi:hypothetical protein